MLQLMFPKLKMKKIFRDLSNAYRAKDVEEILGMLKELIDWQPVGGKKNNSGIIEMGSDPASSLTERITNGIDAVLERQWLKRKNDLNLKRIQYPRQFTEKCFGIPNGNLAEVINIKEYSHLTNLLTVTLYDSDNKNEPTIEIRDKGIGIKSSHFKDTILSLNESNKVGKKYLMGAYGQGGSTALAISQYTIFISKYHLLAEETKINSKVAFTIVRRNEGNLDTDKNAWYEYMVNKDTRNPFEIENSRFDHGTLVRHISSDLGKYKFMSDHMTNSFNYLSNHYLFDPVIPFTISDKRTTIGKTHRRTVWGNNKRLTAADHKEYHQEVPIQFRKRSLKIFYWVLDQSGNDPRNRIKMYTNTTSPIIITYNGQRQGYLSSSLIKNDLKLPYLESYLIVHIQADRVDSETRRKLFSSTRETIKQNSIKKELESTLLNVLRLDKDLKRLNDERREKFFTKVDQKSHEKIKRRLLNRISQHEKSGTATKAIEKDKAPKRIREREPIPIKFPPEILEITTRSAKKITAKKIFYVEFKTDASPWYFTNADTFIVSKEKNNLVSKYTGTTNIVDGYGKAYFKTHNDAIEGDVDTITLELRPRNQSPLIASHHVEVVLPPILPPNPEGKSKSPKINFLFINRDNKMFNNLSWDDNSVSKVIEDNNGIIIYVSEENKHLDRLVKRGMRRSEKAVDKIKNTYLEDIVFTSYMSEKKKAEEKKLGDEEYLDEIIHSRLSIFAEALCVRLSSLFEMIVTDI